MFLNRRIILRVRERLVREVKLKIRANPDKYYSVAHFVRVAVEKELRR